MMEKSKAFTAKTALIVSLGFTALLVMTFSPASQADHCEPYSKKIEKIKAKMRQGYSIKQGEKLKKALIQWQDKRAECEKTKHPKKKKHR